MNRRKLSLLLGLLVVTAYGKALADFPIPHMEQRGAATAIDRQRQALSGALGRTGQHRAFRPRLHAAKSSPCSPSRST